MYQMKIEIMHIPKRKKNFPSRVQEGTSTTYGETEENHESNQSS